MPGLPTVEEALALVLAHVPEAPGAERVPLAEAAGRVLAQDVAADADHPAFPRSRVDGWALRAADAGEALRVVAEIPAGKAPGDRVGAGEAARIFTGAPVPDGADLVAKQEDCEELRDADGGRRVRVPRTAVSEDFVVARGAEASRGAVVLRTGTTVTPAAVGVLAAVGCAHVAVRPRPRVRVLATGSELCAVDERPAPGRIRNSNAPALAAAAAALGGAVLSTATAPDDERALADALGRVLDADVALVTGGVSVGDFDLVPAALERLGARKVLHGVRLQPGKPLWFGTRGGTLVFGLPGNPVSALVNVALFVRPAMARLLGRRETAGEFEVRLGAALPRGGNRRRYVPAQASRAGAQTVATPVPFRGSGDVFGFAAADLLLVIDEGAAARTAGEPARAVRLGEALA
jgi:molybdopterin molybdotransferase